ncbi:MAG TPA: hypothetical protein VEJ84_05775 [Acidimicrobiales bacterium]|nr:hypothetical protein [Acidimicrobiales bacterium]
MARDSVRVFAARNARARELGWRSYGQRRYWEPRFGLRGREVVDRDRQEATAVILGHVFCPHHPASGSSRQGSYVCRRCNLIVNPYQGDRRGLWQARLVQAVERKRKREAARSA